MSILLNGFVHMSLVAVLGIITLVAAIAFATHPGERKLGFIRPLSVATTFSILSAICGGMGATFLRVSSVVETGEPGGLHQAMIADLAETTVPGIIGFALLALSWFLVFVGLRRMA